MSKISTAAVQGIEAMNRKESEYQTYLAAIEAQNRKQADREVGFCDLAVDISEKVTILLTEVESYGFSIEISDGYSVGPVALPIRTRWFGPFRNLVPWLEKGEWTEGFAYGDQYGQGYYIHRCYQRTWNISKGNKHMSISLIPMSFEDEPGVDIPVLILQWLSKSSNKCRGEDGDPLEKWRPTPLSRPDFLGLENALAEFVKASI